MYVCICQAVTDHDIREAAAAGARSIDDLRDNLGVSAFCGSCAPVARSVLDACAGGDAAVRAAAPQADPLAVAAGSAAPSPHFPGEPVVFPAGWFTPATRTA